MFSEIAEQQRQEMLDTIETEIGIMYHYAESLDMSLKDFAKEVIKIIKKHKEN